MIPDYEKYFTPQLMFLPLGIGGLVHKNRDRVVRPYSDFPLGGHATYIAIGTYGDVQHIVAF